MEGFLEIIKIGGPAVATATIFLWYFDRLDRRTKNLIENHLQHLSEALNKNTVVLERLATLISKLNRKR